MSNVTVSDYNSIKRGANIGLSPEEIAKRSKALTNAIRRAAGKATGLTKLSAADHKAGRDEAFYMAECDRLEKLVLSAREGSNVVHFAEAAE